MIESPLAVRQLIKVSLLLLSLGLSLLAPADAVGPQQKPEYPQGTSVVNPGAELWREVRQRDLPVSGITQVRGVDSGVLINARGDQWARFRIDALIEYGPYMLTAIFLLVLLVYVLRGRVGVEGGLSGQVVQRFNDTERIVHWTLAIVFLFLALTGLILLFGRPLLIPLFGKPVFALLASASKEGHNLFGPLFLVSLLMMLVSFARRNLYERGDLAWLLKGGGFIGKGHVSGGFFNMGEKIWYWLVILLGLVVALSGLVLVSPSLGQGRVVMELSHVVHVIGAVILMAVSIGHMYMGSIGTEGSAEGMVSGYVDINWAEAHHDRWAKACREQGRVISAAEFARLQGKPAGADSATEPTP